MAVSRILRRLLVTAAVMAAVFVLVLAIVSFFRIRIDLTGYKGMVESAATLALGRPVKIDEKIAFTTSLQPTFIVKGLRIPNPEGFPEGDVMKMETTRIRVRLLPLLLKKIQIVRFVVKGFSLTLLENKQGAVNWVWATAEPSKSDEPPTDRPMPEKPRLELTDDSLVLSKLILENIAVSYQSARMADPYRFNIDECRGEMQAGKEFSMTIKGKLLDQPYTSAVTVGSLRELLKDDRSWVETQTDIADTRFEFVGSIELAQVMKTLNVKAHMQGARLDSLNRLLDLDLPPLKDYEAAGVLALQRDRVRLSDFVVRVGGSRLTGKMAIDSSGKKSVSTVDLRAPLIQLTDFDVGDWSPDGKAPDGPLPSDEKGHGKESGKGGKLTGKHRRDALPDAGVNELLSAEVLTNFDLKMTVKADKVMSGPDALGGGIMTAMVEAGRLTVDPLTLDIPGGSLNFFAAVKPGKTKTAAAVRAVVKNFDFGVLVRRTNPAADMGGIIDLDVDLKTTAGTIHEIMSNGNGYFDFSGRLENLKAGIIDLWAVNLIAAILSSQEKDASQVNCVVGRWRLEDGLLTPDIFMIDTSKIRICATGKVDFRTNEIDLRAMPTPKSPKFFSLATPIQVKGRFSDLGVGIEAGGILGTAVKFIVSPVQVPIGKLVTKDLPADGSDACGMAIGPENRDAKPPRGCR